jgi:phenylacetate-CoA ligase
LPDILRIPGLFGQLWNHPRLGRERVVAFQNNRLQKVLAFAYKNVPHYKEIWDKAGVLPEDIRTCADLSYLPLTSKKDFQEQPAEKTIALGIRRNRLTVHKTTGSTGEPLSVRRTAFEELITGVLRMRVMHAYGLRRRDKVARIGTRTRKQMPLAWRIFQIFGQYRQELLHLLDAPENLAKRLLEIRPDAITGNAGVLARVSQEFRFLPSHPVRPRFVVTGAEVSTPLMKKDVRAAFRAPVYDTYASEEFDIIAWECPETGRYHICDDSLILEVLRNGSPAAKGERGEVVGTSLHFLAMPFIRFQLGDEVTAGEETCPCGLPFSTISALDGRKTDYLILPGGRELFASAIAYILHDKAPWVERYELVQEREDEVALRVVSGNFPAGDKIHTLKQEIQARLGPGVTFLLERVSQIEPGPGGKFRVLRSHVRSAYEKKKTLPQ